MTQRSTRTHLIVPVTLMVLFCIAQIAFVVRVLTKGTIAVWVIPVIIAGTLFNLAVVLYRTIVK